MRADAAHEDRGVADNGEAMGMTADLVKVDQLAALRIGLREQPFAVVGFGYRDHCVESSARRVIAGPFEIFSRLRHLHLAENLASWRGGDEAQERRIVV